MSDHHQTSADRVEPQGVIWEDGRWTALPHLIGSARCDVCVVGLGGSGLSAIHALLDHGVTVVGLDANSIAGGAAGANGGFLLAGAARFYHRVVADIGRDRAREIYRRTAEEIERMVREMPDIVRRTGSLRIATSAEELDDCEGQYEAMRADDLAVERYDGPEGKGLLIPGDAVFNPLARCRRLAHAALARGARLYEHSRALQIAASTVLTEQGRVNCRAVIVAVDGHPELLFPELQDRVRTARLQMLATAPTGDVRFTRPVYARYGYEYWQQLSNGAIALGGFRDQGGEDEWTHSPEPSVAIQNRLTEFLRSTLRVQASITHRWAASVGYTNTGLPILEEARPNVWVTGGYCGTGNVIGALCGRALAERVTRGSSVVFDLFRSR